VLRYEDPQTPQRSCREAFLERVLRKPFSAPKTSR